jgi:plasmid replication initiation protein
MAPQSDLFDAETDTPRPWVVVSNEFVMARLDWSIMMHRIMMVLISQIDSQNDDVFRTQRLRVKDIAEKANLETKTIHEQAVEAVSKLVREPIELRTEDGSYTGVPIFAKCRYLRHRGIVTAKFNENARPHLLQLEKRFTMYRLEQAIPLSTPYAIRHYELAKMIERPTRVGEKMFSEQRFRKMFRLEHKYSRFRDMVGYVVDPSVEQVNEKCDVTINYDIVRDGRTPVGLNFKVRAHEGEDESPTIQPAPEPEMAPYETWFESLEPDRWKELTERAERMAKEAGYDTDTRAFDAGLQHAMRTIYREETGAMSGDQRPS